MAITAWNKESPEPDNASDQKLLSESKELHVLAVDDSLVDRKVIERLLKLSSCKVTAVESGTSALQYLGLDGDKETSLGFDDLKINLIMTDYSMPGMTGYELLKKLKTSSALRKIPVVIMSSENIMARIDRCLEEGAEDFLVKPVKLSDVKRLKDFVLKGEGEKKKISPNKRKIKDDPPPLQNLKEDPSSVLPQSSPLLPARLSRDLLSPSTLASFTTSSPPHSVSKRPRL